MYYSGQSFAWNPTSQKAVINGQGQGRCVTISDASPTISNFVITNGVEDTSDWDYGGGIHIEGSAAPKILENHILGNLAERGGGLSCRRDEDHYPSPSIVGNIFQNNQAIFHGGAVHMYELDSGAEFHYNVLIDNTAGGLGGAMHLLIDKRLDINYNVFASNGTTENSLLEPDKGGAVYVHSGDDVAYLKGNVFYENLADDKGGAFYHASSGSTRLINNTIADNSANDLGGGIFAAAGTVNATNSIIWGNAALGDGDQVYADQGSTVALNYTCYENGTGDIAGTGSVNPDSNCLNQDPLFADPGSGDYHLRSRFGSWDFNGNGGAGNWMFYGETSPCIDHGDPATDYGGEPEPNGGCVNMGAYGNTSYASKSDAWWPVDGDANHDCKVNVLDLIFVRNRLGDDISSGATWRGDVNDDGTVNVLDLIYVRNRLGSACDQ